MKIMNEQEKNIQLEVLSEIYEVDKLNILAPDSITFVSEKSGFLTAQYNGKQYKKATLTRLIPFVTKTEYISVSYENEEKEFREIGVIKDIAEMPKEQFETANSFLLFKYYMPEVTKIYSIRDNMMGYIFVKIDCTAGKKTLCIGDWYSNFKMLNKDYLYICDADGNKYFCPDVHKLDRQSLAHIEMFV